MLKSSVFAIAFFTSAGGAYAQQVPDAGQQIQQIYQPPIVERPAPDILIDRPAVLT
ncbi:MAG: hypothetical protein HEQ34_09905 [Sphingorhabdus sp.]|uniref:hypothetical protein n=1 Tax=Sphingorhabdus sp. TaxID=1902408 RepID=UPI0025D22D38|nr:hypothetical protein [Sphingorhabdus sp.]MCO4092251.1 hypothetical protein [Sphingorhabdus sp.]